jgi:hypothetical protein
VADVQILAPGTAAAPLDYVVPGAQEIFIKTATANFNGTSAVGSYVPTLQIIGAGGVVALTCPIGQVVAAGASADASWFPGLGVTPTPSSPTGHNLFVTAAGMWPSVTSGSSFPTRIETATNKVNVYLVDFADGSQLFAQSTYVMPSNYAGSTITATFYWTVSSNTAGNVIWGVAGRAYGGNAAIDAAFGTAQTVTSASSATAGQTFISSATAAVTLAGSPAAGQLVQFRFYRDGAAGGDTMAATARLYGVSIAY